MEMKNGYFGELNKYMDEILAAIISSPNISKLLAYTDVDMYGKAPVKNPLNLLYKNIFPYGYVPDIQHDKESYITIQLDDFRPSKGNYFLYSYVVISAIVHDELQRTNYGNRSLLLYEEIHRVMNERDMGIGRLRFNSGRIIRELKKPYSGHYLVYELVDFNK